MLAFAFWVVGVAVGVVEWVKDNETNCIEMIHIEMRLLNRYLISNGSRNL